MIDPTTRERLTATLGGAVEYRIHHIGIAAGGERSARRIMSALGLQPAWSNVLERHQCRCEYCPGPPIDVELVVPLSAASSTRKIPLGLHHLGVAVADIADAQSALERRGYAMLELEPLNILDRYLVNFIEPLRIGFLVELVQELGSVNVRALYSGFVPLASCHWQGMANLLEAQGLPRARQKLCLTWGFSWAGPGSPLGHSGRWLELFNHTFEAAVRREQFDCWRQACERELALATAGLPFVAEIDAWEIPSEHHRLRHVAHTVLVLDRGEREVVVLDTMNLPEPRTYPLAQYARMRTHPCVDRLHLYSSARPPRRDPPPEPLLAIVAADFRANRCGDRADLDGYLEWARGDGQPLDVCRVGAERLQLAATFALLAELRPEMIEISRGLASLSKRWYLVHTLAEQQQNGRDSRARELRLLADLREREMRLGERFETMTGRPLTLRQ